MLLCNIVNVCLHCTAFACIMLYRDAVNCIGLYRVASQGVALYSDVSHYIPLRCVTLISVVL